MRRVWEAAILRKASIAAAALTACLLSPPAHAAISPVTEQCIMASSGAFKIPYRIILGFLKTEGGRLGMESPNRNGTYDLGPMQVNSGVWVPRLARMHFHGDETAAWDALRDHGCYNIVIGTWIYRQYVDEAHGDLAEAVGLYNSHNEGPKRAYQMRFAQNFSRLFGIGER